MSAAGGADLPRWAGPSKTTGGSGIAGLAPTDKKTTMRTIAKLAHLGGQGGRPPLSDILLHVRRALAAAGPDRRPARPLQDIDDWSDQAEVAFYEDCRGGRCP